MYRGDLAKAKAALAGGADVNAVYDRDTMLCWALRNEPEMAKLILQSPGVDVNKRSVGYDAYGEWERTPLILAAHMGQAEIVGALLRLGAQVNARDRTDSVPESRGDTALIKAAQRDHADVIQALVTQGKGLDVNARTKDGNTPLWFIAEHEDLATLRLLREHGAKIDVADNVGQSVLVTTFAHKNREVLEYLVAQGADINHVDQGGHTPLMAAVASLGGKEGKAVLGFLERFLAFRPKLDVQQVMPKGGGYSALHLAARFGYADAARLLLDNGAAIDIQSLNLGETPLHAAASANQVALARYLISRRADVGIFDKSGSTPLLVAAIQADPDMVQALVEGGAAIDAKSTVNVLATPLVYAAANPDPFKHKNNLAIIAYLLSRKGGVDFPSASGRTALMAAAQQSDAAQGYERAALLIEKGAKLDLANDKGETALMLAAGAGNGKLVQLLMDKGADAGKRNGAGETVMSYASRAGDKSGAKLLEAKGVPPEAPIVRKGVIVDALLGTWKGFQDGLPQALYTVVLNRDGAFDFSSRLTPETLKQFPAGTVNPVIAAQKGTYTFDNDTMIWSPVGAPPTSMKWRLENGMLIIDNKIRLKKSK